MNLRQETVATMNERVRELERELARERARGQALEEQLEDVHQAKLEAALAADKAYHDLREASNVRVEQYCARIVDLEQALGLADELAQRINGHDTVDARAAAKRYLNARGIKL